MWGTNYREEEGRYVVNDFSKYPDKSRRGGGERDTHFDKQLLGFGLLNAGTRKRGNKRIASKSHTKKIADLRRRDWQEKRP